MKLKIFSRKQKPRKAVSPAREWINSITFAVTVATIFRWSIVQAFVIPTPSMENSMLVGDYLFVSKLHYGPQTPRTPLQFPLTHQKFWGTEIPSYLDWIQLPTYRFPGFSRIHNGDVVVFNVPAIEENEGIDYPPDLKNNYVKRCVGIAGDVISVKDRQVYVNGQPLANPPNMKFSYLVTATDEIHKRNLTSLGLDHDDYYYLGRTKDNKALYKMLLTPAQLEQARSSRFLLSVEDDYTTHTGSTPGLFPHTKGLHWNEDNYGPLWIPAKGATIPVNDSTLGIYGETIQKYDLNESVNIRGNQLIVNGKNVTSYTFNQDYYFMMGDSRHNSQDSRFWGFVPADHIVGKPLFVWMSVDSDADLLHSIRWNRLLRPVR